MKTASLVVWVYLVSAASPGLAQVTRIVDDDAQGSAMNCDDTTTAFATVGAAVAAAGSGDTVLVCPGTYVENINFSGKAIAVRSVAGSMLTTLDGNAADSVVTFASGEGPASVLEGFTIRNGRSGFDTPGFGNGGGIRISNASPRIYANAVVGNRGCAGVGISVGFGSPVIEGNTIAENVQVGCTGGTGGGGIGILGVSTAVIRNNIIRDNTLTGADGGGISLFAAGSDHRTQHNFRQQRQRHFPVRAGGWDMDGQRLGRDDRWKSDRRQSRRMRWRYLLARAVWCAWALTGQ
jgi:uncharacterized protein DUF1565